MQAIASAQAIAIAQITQTCTIIGESRVCSITSAQANATARVRHALPLRTPATYLGPLLQPLSID